MSNGNGWDQPCSAEKPLSDFIQTFNGLAIKMHLSAQKVDETHAIVTTLSEHAKHLSNLEKIATAIYDIKNQAFDAAVGKKQVPISVFLIVLFTMCLLFVLRELGARDFKVTPTSMEIETHKYQTPIKGD